MNQQARISRQNERLQKAVGAQNKLFSIMAHDLRSPLASLSNIIKLITIYIDNSRYNEAAELSRQMDRKNDHLLELTDNLLDWTKSQTESFTPVFERVKLSEVVAHCVKIYQPVSIDKEIALHYEQDGDCYLLADRNMLQTILRNLINNAIKFTARKGKVQIICEQRQGFARITVSDNGIGISRERMESIFEIDVKNIQNGTEGEKSTGLGLSVCKEFIEAMGGTIFVESQEQVGTSFIFTIPLYAPRLQHGQQLPAPVPSAGSPGH
jgi:signal transduction histidine kinase